MKELRDDTRGLAVGIVVFFMMLIIGALLFILFDSALSPLFDMTRNQAETSGGVEQINLAEAIWDNILYVVAFFAVMYLIGRAVRESGRMS